MDIKNILKKQRDYFQTGKTREISFRRDKLKILRKAIQKHENKIMDALKSDLNKSPFESYCTEIGIVLEELRFAIRHLSSWARPKRVKTPITHFLSRSHIHSEPYGVSLIMSPWNYPFQLTIAPLIGSIAAGNCSIVKPSAYSPATSSIMAAIVRECFDEEFVAVIEGGRKENEALLNEKFDKIFFTGSVAVGKTVMQAAARHLTPVTLELGGKSPCIVDREVNIDLAAKRIAWGKFINSGQTCVAPDYLMAHKSIKNLLLAKIKKYVEQFYGTDPCGNPQYPRIVNEKHFKRLLGLMGSGEIVFGGSSDGKRLVISPTVIDKISWNDPIMQEEIFGPILPVLEYEDLSGVITAVNSRPSPLALYFFSTNKENEEKIVKNIPYGGGCINDTLVHLATSHMPFGGVGNSGMGGYHGKASFDSFSHKKSILKKSFLIDVWLRYPPFNDTKLKLLKLVMR